MMRSFSNCYWTCISVSLFSGFNIEKLTSYLDINNTLLLLNQVNETQDNTFRASDRLWKEKSNFAGFLGT